MDNHTREVKKIIDELKTATKYLAGQIEKSCDDRLPQMYHHYSKLFLERIKEIKELEEYLVWWEGEIKREAEEQASMRRCHRLAEQMIGYYAYYEKQK